VELYLHSHNTPSWHGAKLTHRENFTFTFYLYENRLITLLLSFPFILSVFPSFSVTILFVKDCGGGGNSFYIIHLSTFYLNYANYWRKDHFIKRFVPNIY
jgi:hypothetical protein